MEGPSLYAMSQSGLLGDSPTAQHVAVGLDTSMTGMLEEAALDSFGAPRDSNSQGQNIRDSAGDAPYNSLAEPSGLMSNGSGAEQGDSSKAETSLSGVGAGPLPMDFGAQSTIGGGSTLTDFTKRRNWPQRVLEELKDFLHILTPDGRILYLSPSGQGLTGYHADELVGKFIIDYIHPDDSGIFMREFNESIASGNPLRFFYRFRKKDSSYGIFESHGHPHLTSEAAAFGPTNSAGFCRGFFMMARPYPTKNAALLDSFLEHKMENERLRRRIDDLKREEAEEADEAQRSWEARLDGRSSLRSDGSTIFPTNSANSVLQQNPDILAMPPPAKPGSTSGLTRQNLEDADSSRQPDSIRDKMARYEGTSHIESIEMLTGLRYQDGERSQGISTGGQSPSLIRGDAGIALPTDKDARGGDKKKKIRLPEEYVCTDCGTLDSPEWRKGPTGPKTLCNACGLRWAKKEKKETKDRLGSGTAPAATTSPDE